MIVDLHCHLLKEEGYLENLVREAKKLGLSKMCLNGLGELYDELGNETSSGRLSGPESD